MPMMLVRRQELPFDLFRLMRDCAETWPSGRLPDGYDDVVIAEMDRRGLRSFTPADTEALFDPDRSVEEYRACILEALTQWKHQGFRPRTPEEHDAYRRQD